MSFAGLRSYGSDSFRVSKTWNFALLFLSLLIVVCFFFPSRAHAQLKLADPAITTVTGDGTYCGSVTGAPVATYPCGDGGAATGGRLYNPYFVVFDRFGNLYISDAYNYRLRKVAVDPTTGTLTANSIITTVAGDGTLCGVSASAPVATYPCGDGGPAVDAQVGNIEGLAFDSAGNLYVAGPSSNRIRKISADSTGAISASSIITTVAGNGERGYNGDDISATSASVYSPTGLAFDSAGNLYIGDNGNFRIRRVNAVVGVITAASTITTVVGNGTGCTPALYPCGDGGPATGAQLYDPYGLAFDNAGNFFIADGFSRRVLKVSAIAGVIDPVNSIITTVAGDRTACTTALYPCGDGGPATSAQLSNPQGVAVDGAGNLYIGDAANNRVRKVSAVAGVVNPANSIITTVAGTGTSGYNGDGISATSARLNLPAGLAFDSAGNLYIADLAGARVRRLEPLVFPDTAVGLSSPAQNVYVNLTAAQAVGSFNVLPSFGGQKEFSIDTTANLPVCADPANPAVTYPVDGTTIMPAGTVCALSVEFIPQWAGLRRIPLQVTTSNGVDTSTTVSWNLGLIGLGLGPVIQLTPSILSIYAGTNETACPAGTTLPGDCGDGGPATSAQIAAPSMTSFDYAGNMYITAETAYAVRKVDATTKNISTAAGIGTACTTIPPDDSPAASACGDDGPATSAQVSASAAGVDSAGNLYLADNFLGRVRKVDAITGIITTFAGGGAGCAGVTAAPYDGCPATSASLSNTPGSLIFDRTSNLYIADNANYRIRKVDATSGILTTVAGDGTMCSATTFPGCGDGGPATSAQLNPGSSQLTLDSAGNIYFASRANNVIRKVDAVTGIITTVAGTGMPGYAGDGSAASGAQLSEPLSVAVDAAGNFYIADQAGSVIRKVDTSGTITTIAGNGAGLCGGAETDASGDGCSAINAKISINGLAFDTVGNLYLADYDRDTVRMLSATQAAVMFATLTGTGGTALYTDATPQQVTVTNIGNASLTLASAATGTNPTVPADFALNSTATTCETSTGATIPQGESCNLAFDFVPVADGLLSERAILFSNSVNAAMMQPAQATIMLVGTSVQVTITITPETLPGGTVGTSYSSQTLAASSTLSPTATFTYAVTSGSLPPGLSLDSNTGTISGIATTAGSYDFTITATDNTPSAAGGPYTGTQNYTNVVIAKGTPGEGGIAAVTVESSLNPSTYGVSVTLTATVPSSPTAATGTVQFLDNNASIGCDSVTISGTTATCIASELIAGIHPITAVYSGNSNYNEATSATLNQVVNLASSTGTLTANGSQTPDPVTYGSSVTLVDTIAPVPPMGEVGTVIFCNGPCLSDGSNALGTVNVTPDGTATLMVNLPVGSYNIVAQFGGTNSVNSSTSNTVALSVSAGDFVVTATPSAQSALPGVEVSFPVDVSGPYICQVDLSYISDPLLPEESVVVFTPQSVTPGASEANATMTVNIPPQKSVAMNTAGFSIKASLALEAMLFPLMAWRRRRNLGRILILVVFGFASTAAIIGCSPGGYFAQPSQKYTITVIGTSECGGATHNSTPVTLTVDM